VILSPAPRKNKMRLTIALNTLNSNYLGKPYKLFFLGAGENRKLNVHCLLLLLCVRILLLPTLIAVLVLLLVVDFSQKIWYNHGIVGGEQNQTQNAFIFLGKIIFIKMVNYEDAMKYIEEQEATDISYVKIGDNSKNLIVSFASNSHTGFDKKTSLMKLKYQRNNFDVLYLRDDCKWYLDGLNGIGENIDSTIAFLKKEFTKYEDVLCTGASAGGYASLLFGSLLKIKQIVAVDPQTDLSYLINELARKHPFRKNLRSLSRSRRTRTTWNKYNKIASVLSEDVLCNVLSLKDENYNRFWMDLVLHGTYHYEQIKHFPNVIKFESMEEVLLLIEKFLEETS
tara:strand:- start:18 stop:1037 length:1020 start_codon:yes stop_codon:yes gene_type:complete